MFKNLGSIALALVATSQILLADEYRPPCPPQPPAHCNEVGCCTTYCLGPDNMAINAPVRPYTCNGDWELTLAGLYLQGWERLQSGVRTVSDQRTVISTPYNWEFGFEAGIGYNGNCDNWDFSILWTHIKTSAHVHEEEELEQNTLEVLSLGEVTDYSQSNKNTVDYIDIALGRDFWNGQKLSFHPYIGFRVAIGETEQDLAGTPKVAAKPNTIKHQQFSGDYTGFGILFGVDSNWNLGCGWAVFGEFAFTYLGGYSDTTLRSYDQETETPFNRRNSEKFISEGSLIDSFYDLVLGVKWAGFFCDCDYRLEVSLGWEHRAIPELGVLSLIQSIGLNSSFKQPVHGAILRFTFDF